MRRGVEQIIYEEMLRDLNLFSFQKRRLKQDFIAVFNYIMGDFKGDRARLFLEAHSERTSEI